MPEPDVAGHFDAVVIGSGFGGSVVAERLAAAGKTVCVLERGNSYPPNSFPRDPVGLAHNLWDPHHGLYGMFDMWSFKGIESVVSSGLGGGSLIYANVLIRKDERWFVKEDRREGGYEYWPITREDLERHYDAVEVGLDASRYPFEHAPYSDTPKTIAMQEAAESLRLEWMLPKLAVTFANRGRPPVPGEVIEGGEHNLHHATRTTCRLCGECDIGCNYGAKNTLDYTYLSAAEQHGADIRTLSEVRAIDRHPKGGYTVSFLRHDPEAGPEPRDRPLTVLHADRLVVSAGALGSPYLLLRNRAAFPHLSPALGSHFSGNGDLLTFITHTRRAGAPRALESSIGPVITSAIRMADEVDGTGVHGRGFYVEDGGNPAFLNYLMESTSAPSLAYRSGKFILQRMIAHASGNPRSHYSAAGRGALRRQRRGRDDSPGPCHGPRHPRRGDVAPRRRPRAQLDHRFVSGVLRPRRNDPGPHRPRPWRQVSQHPLMAVQAGDHGPSTRRMPNGARRERRSRRQLGRGVQLPGDVRVGRVGHARPDRPEPVAHHRSLRRPSSGRDPGKMTPHCSISFTEEMKGSFVFGEVQPGPAASPPTAGQGAPPPQPFMFHLTISTPDLAAFMDDATHEAPASGWVQSDALGGRLAVQRGVFNLFVAEGPHAKRMLYRLHFSDAVGRPLTMTGYKEINGGPLTKVWPETTTLYIRILRGHVGPDEDSTAEAVGAGVLRILPADFAEQLSTFRAGRGSPIERAKALADFAKLFAGELLDVFWPPRLKTTPPSG